MLRSFNFILRCCPYHKHVVDESKINRWYLLSERINVFFFVSHILPWICLPKLCTCCFHCATIYWMLDLCRTASYEITIVLRAVPPWLSFLKIRSLVFSDFAHNNSWPLYLVTDEVRVLKKKLKTRIWAQGT